MAKTKKPIILSTGLSTYKDIKLAIKTIRSFGNNKIIVLKCTTAYPSELKEQNLSTISDIKKKFKGKFELTSLVGNITTKNGSPFVHIHVNVSDEACNAYGGHLFSGTITATGELIIFLSNSVINRKESSDIGLYLWNLNEDN